MAYRQSSIGFGALALIMLLAGSRSAGAQTPITVRIAALPTDQAAEPFYAQELGFFKRAGINATVSVFTSGPAITAAVLGGAFDIGVSNVPTLATAHEKGLPLVIVAPGGLYSSNAPTDICAVKSDSAIRTAKDLNGKTVGVVGLHNIGQLGAVAWLDQNGADLNSIKFVEIPFSGVGPALAEDRIDAGVLIDPALQEALDAGQARMLSKCFDAIAPQFVVVAYFSTSDFAKSHPDVISKVAAVMAETAKWANAHQRQSAQILEKWAKVHVTPDMARAVYPDRLSAAQIQPVLDAAAKYKMLKATFPATDLFAPGVGGQ